MREQSGLHAHELQGRVRPPDDGGRRVLLRVISGDGVGRDPRLRNVTRQGRPDHERRERMRQDGRALLRDGSITRGAGRVRPRDFSVPV